MLAVIAGIGAFLQRRSAQNEARVALARELGAKVVVEPRIDRAMLLAREAVNLDDSRQTAGTLLATLLRSPAALGTFTVPITDRPLQIVLSPDGKTLAAATNTDKVRFFDTRTRRESRPPLLHHGFLPTVYTSNGLLLAAGGTGKPSIDVFDARTMRRVRPLALDDTWLKTPTSPLEPMFVSPDGRTAYFAYAVVNPDGSDGKAYLDRWDLQTGKRLGPSPLGFKGMFDGRTARHGRELVFLGDHELTTWDARTLRRLSSTPVSVASNSSMEFAVVSPNGATVAVATRAGSVSFEDLRTSRVSVGAGKMGVAVQGIVFSPAGDRVVTTDESGHVTVWNPATADPVETFIGHGGRTTGIAFSADGKTLFTSSLDGAVFEWDLGNQRRFGRGFDAYPAPEDEQAVEHNPLLAVSPDGNTFATAPGGNQVALFSVRSLRRTNALTALPKDATVTSVAWSPKGSLLAVGGKGLLRLWDVGGRPRLVRSLTGLSGTVQQATFSPDGSLVAAVDGDKPQGPGPPVGHLAVWQVDSGALRAPPRDLHTDGWAVALSPDGKSLAAGDGGGSVLILDARSVRLERTLHPIGAPNVSLAFAPDGTLATGSWAGVVQRWDVSTGKQLGQSVLATPAPIATISFDPSGDQFATGGGSDGLVKLWDTSTLQQLGSNFPGEPGRWASAAFTPDGTRLLVMFGNGRGALWPVTLGAWKDHACTVAGRNFTREEWARYVTGRSFATVCAS